jgi:hypothetical protein
MKSKNDYRSHILLRLGVNAFLNVSLCSKIKAIDKYTKKEIPTDMKEK